MVPAASVVSSPIRGMKPGAECIPRHPQAHSGTEKLMGVAGALSGSASSFRERWAPEAGTAVSRRVFAYGRKGGFFSASRKR